MSNPIADVFDSTVPSLLTDKTRQLKDFHHFASQSVEFQRFQRESLSRVIVGEGSLPEKLYTELSLFAQLWFEAGKNYVINGTVDNVLSTPHGEIRS